MGNFVHWEPLENCQVIYFKIIINSLKYIVQNPYKNWNLHKTIPNF